MCMLSPRKKIFLKAYAHVLEPLPMKMWHKTNNMKIEPPAPKIMSERPKKNRRKDKDELKMKWGKMSRRGLKISCSTYHQIDHNKLSCPVTRGARGSSSSRRSTQTQEHVATQCSQIGPASGHGPGPSNARRSRGRERGRGVGTSIRVTKIAFPNAPHPTAYKKGTPWLKRIGESAESSVAQNKSKNAEFECYINPTTGTTVINPSSSSERVLSHGMNERVMKDTSVVNIDLDFKDPSLKFKGKNAITTRWLQQHAINRRNNPCTQPTPSAAGSCSTAGPTHAAP